MRKRARISVISIGGLPNDEQRQHFVNQLRMALFAWVETPLGRGNVSHRMAAMTQEPRRRGRARMREYAQAVVEGWTEGELLRLHLHELPRSLMDLSDAERNALLSERPPLTGTPWDQLLAAIVEHVCELHGLTAPAWSQEQERFRSVPHVLHLGAGDDDADDGLRAGGVHPARRPRRSDQPGRTRGGNGMSGVPGSQPHHEALRRAVRRA